MWAMSAAVLLAGLAGLLFCYRPSYEARWYRMCPRLLKLALRPECLEHAPRVGHVLQMLVFLASKGEDILREKIPSRKAWRRLLDRLVHLRDILRRMTLSGNNKPFIEQLSVLESGLEITCDRAFGHCALEQYRQQSLSGWIAWEDGLPSYHFPAKEAGYLHRFEALRKIAWSSPAAEDPYNVSSRQAGSYLFLEGRLYKVLRVYELCAARDTRELELYSYLDGNIRYLIMAVPYSPDELYLSVREVPVLDSVSRSSSRPASIVLDEETGAGALPDYPGWRQIYYLREDLSGELVVEVGDASDQPVRWAVWDYNDQRVSAVWIENRCIGTLWRRVHPD